MSVDTFHMFPHSNYCHSGSSSNKSDSVEKLFLPGTKAAFAVFFLILCIAQVATSSLLVHGARKVAAEEDKLLIKFDRFASLITPWIIVTTISLIQNLIEMVGVILRAPVVSPNTSLLYDLALLKSITGYLGLVVLAVAFYIFIVVWSFRFWVYLKAFFQVLG